MGRVIVGASACVNVNQVDNCIGEVRISSVYVYG